MKGIAYIVLALMVAFSIVSSGSATWVNAATENEPGLFTCSTVTEIPIEECYALVMLYNSTNGGGWSRKDNWLVSNNPDDWFGVSLAVGHVAGLFLPNNNLSGNIPAEIGTLSHLVQLNLSGNNLVGVLPLELGSLGNLLVLALDHNQFSGSLPIELGNLANLNYLAVDHNQISGTIPAELGNLRTLRTLFLQYNQLWGDIPDSFVNLTNLYDPGGNNGADGLDLDYDYLNVPADYPNPENPLHVFLFRKDPDWHLRQGEFCSFVTQIPEVECNALVTLYNGTNGGQWYYKTNWLVTDRPSYWYGITIASGHVINLSLPSNNLQGSLPAELGNLANLQYLYLRNNQLSGSIPAELGNLISLWYLDLSNNQLSGNLPAELGNLANIVDMRLYNNQLSGSIPAQLGNLAILQYVNLYNNQLSGSIPVELGNLTNLTYLYLYNNQLSGSIPAELGDLINLQHLNLSNNQINGAIPWELGNIINLGSLDLSNNLLSGSLPIELVNLANLSYLAVDHNQLSGTIPAEIDNLTNIQVLRLNQNRLEGNIPGTLANLTGLADPGTAQDGGDGLDLDYNYLNVPVDYPNPQNPLHLFLQGKDPDWHLRQGELCAIVIEIPEAECNALVSLYNHTSGANWNKQDNWFVTNTPSDWFGVSLAGGHVATLSLPDNNLSGTIPAEIGNLSYLVELNLGGNNLVGGLPAEIGNLSFLVNLDLRRNKLVGALPVELGNLASLGILELDHNRLSGSLPAELGSLVNLAVLELDHNQLTGGVPAELGALPALQWLNLSFNRLSGNIPLELANLPNLTELKLNRNHLDGPLPAELGNLGNLQVLALDHNQFSGSLPLELGNLASLNSLAVDHNQISGTIPAQIGNLISLQVLRLNDNQLDGDIPGTLANLTSLVNPGMAQDGGDGLDLDYNQLNVPANYPDPGDPLQVFLQQKDPDWHMYQGFEQLIGSGGGTFTSLDGKTAFVVPPGALDGDTIFSYIPHSQPAVLTVRLGFAHNSFQLSAEDTSGNPVLSFNLPITVTLTYTDTDYISPEDTLALYDYDLVAHDWVDAVTTCPGGEYLRDLLMNTLILPLCHMTEFSLFSTPFFGYIPIVKK